MNRLTDNKNVSEMNMLELAYNSCYAKDGVARYRDFENDYEARDLCRLLFKKYLGIDLPKDDEEFDEYILDSMQYDIMSTEGLLAVFYRNLWAMADLRERLMMYEEREGEL